jgi:hypothetical protein
MTVSFFFVEKDLTGLLDEFKSKLSGAPDKA